ncbi:hypothetical protein HYH03_014863 [Edaphochlamys debaryana]|uniref:Uncharacterized protein n=1 Tax=Edaphochlamys debaryana TaxID=47281 RepID=A0A836BRH4_9CHLO|nr:hypothetical protein HYH03_014863 [Edaphochlamys debaryana]|eukprot:KAG2486416.1 hypothetical protein HYH03_014863 [Edaphochlamys debaryana]
MARLRVRVSHGVNPDELLTEKQRVWDARPTFKPWIVKALLALPEGQGTADEIGAVLLADPVVAPHLDRRLATDRRAPTPQWRVTLSKTLIPCRGFFNTGRKRKGRVVYGYDPQAAVASKRTRARKQGRAGMPHLGKRSW